MPQLEDIILVPDLQVDKVEGPQKGRITVHASFCGKKRCPHCISRQLRSKGSYVRKLKHTRIGNKLVQLHVRVFRYKCKKCPKGFVTKIPRVLSRRRATEVFRMEAFEDHFAGHTGDHVSRTRKISPSTVERWFKDFLQKRYKDNWCRHRTAPRVLGIDEHFFTRKKGYATTFVNLGSRYVFDVVQGRSKQALKHYLMRLQGRERVQVVVMDLSATYRSIVEEYFPNAKIVADRFHVVRLIQQQFQKVWGKLDPVGKKHRGLLSLFRRKPENMTDKQAVKFYDYLQSVPGLNPIYEFSQKLLALVRLKTLNKHKVKLLIPKLLKMTSLLIDSPFIELQKLGKTITHWIEPIARMWRFSKTNSITEGFHNKMELIQRRAYGFRNFQNYRLRVLAMCGWNGISKRG